LQEDECQNIFRYGYIHSLPNSTRKSVDMTTVTYKSIAALKKIIVLIISIETLFFNNVNIILQASHFYLSKKVM
jgi:hypothetical protein